MNRRYNIPEPALADGLPTGVRAETNPDREVRHYYFHEGDRQEPIDTRVTYIHPTMSKAEARVLFQLLHRAEHLCMARPLGPDEVVVIDFQGWQKPLVLRYRSWEMAPDTGEELFVGVNGDGYRAAVIEAGHITSVSPVVDPETFASLIHSAGNTTKIARIVGDEEWLRWVGELSPALFEQLLKRLSTFQELRR